ncbi:hypothetical protein [Laspinema palackyanum]|uniref:hypothetical protein n=1 Tax=Laspinema palackyanum TaxID=3231601 RepID=UPI00345D853A|nr:hypothetical protein [Laspinema sp. D2c]
MAHAKDKEKIEELQGESKQSADSPIYQTAEIASEKMIEEVEGLTLYLFQQKLQTRAFGDSFRGKLQALLQDAPQAFEARILQSTGPNKLLTPHPNNG